MLPFWAVLPVLGGRRARDRLGGHEGLLLEARRKKRKKAFDASLFLALPGAALPPLGEFRVSGHYNDRLRQ